MTWALEMEQSLKRVVISGASWADCGSACTHLNSLQGLICVNCYCIKHHNRNLHHCLQDLGLALNEITPVGMANLAVALRGMTSLQLLNLRENELEDRGALLLAPALAHLHALRELDLCGNQLRRAGAVKIARMVAALPAIERLLLDENEVSAEGVAQVKVRTRMDNGMLRLKGCAFQNTGSQPCLLIQHCENA